ncbi:ADP-ribosylglycohydrolase family protein [Candidatus Sumerlaeota bacterium]|nr:ADP-ribosylglycohydrolase family protein [Candidatus Sumerlaeota bacterium]
MEDPKWDIPFLRITKQDIDSERLQCEDEGKNPDIFSRTYKRVSHLDLEDEENQLKAQELIDKIASLSVREDYPYREPSDWEGVLSQQEQILELPPLTLKGHELEDKIYGGWLGRCAGCLLGKPFEGWPRHRLWSFLRDGCLLPLSDYLTVRISPRIRKKYNLPPDTPFVENIHCMPEDGDLNYTVANMALLKKHGRHFTPHDVARFWLENIPILRTSSAERVAYRNLCMNILPPLSASFRNPYREWIGAQIRGDLFGYVLPGNPSLAAELAWRDASISHVKNGIYGEMWVAAMIATAFTSSDVVTILESGLSRIPVRCRLHEAVCEILDWYMQAIEFDEAVERLHRLWDENVPYDRSHVISNAMVVAIALLWGGMDFQRSICRAVQSCFDTDCNGATVGSILGVILGAKKLPKKWIDPLNDTLETGVRGYSRARISELARETLGIIDRIY